MKKPAKLTLRRFGVTAYHAVSYRSAALYRLLVAHALLADAISGFDDDDILTNRQLEGDFELWTRSTNSILT